MKELKNQGFLGAAPMHPSTAWRIKNQRTQEPKNTGTEEHKNERTQEPKISVRCTPCILELLGTSRMEEHKNPRKQEPKNTRMYEHKNKRSLGAVPHAVPRQLVYGHFVYDTSSTDISSTTVYQRTGQLQALHPTSVSANHYFHQL